MPLLAERRFAMIAPLFGGIMSVVLIVLVLRYDHDLRAVIHQKMIERDAAVLTSVAQQEIDTDTLEPARSDPGRWSAALLPAAHRQGLLALAIFDADGVLLESIPSNQLLVELPPDDFVRLQDGRPLTRYWPAFSLQSFLIGGPVKPTPVLEIVLPLHQKSPGAAQNEIGRLIGYVRYHLDARPLAVELATLDAGVRRQTVVTLTVGLAALALLVGTASVMLRRAQRIIAERTARLQRANFELTLAAKTSALGQIMSHLVHGLQGPVAGLRSVVSAREAVSVRGWEAAAGYAEQMQVMIQEIVGLLGDRASTTTYELNGRELTEIIRRRNEPSAAGKGVTLEVDDGFPDRIDSHRGGLLCLIASNLVQNAIEASALADKVKVSLRRETAGITLLVTDEGPGISPELREHLFEPGNTGRTGGTGLGLAISQLLARQIGAALVLHETGPDGTIFRVTLPVDSSLADKTG
jgi:signal transduction histidine kinase